jgi:hypothetical protein
MIADVSTAALGRDALILAGPYLSGTNGPTTGTCAMSSGGRHGRAK